MTLPGIPAGPAAGLSLACGRADDIVARTDNLDGGTRAT